MLRTRILLPAAFLSFLVAPTRLAAQLRGDYAAVSLARRMIDRMGGRAEWSSARVVRVVEEVYHPQEPLPFRSETWWRWLREPRLQGSSRRADGEHAFHYSPAEAWRREPARSTRLPDIERRQWASAWPRNVYVLYARLAREDSSLWMAAVAPRRFAVWDGVTGVRLAEFETNAAGEPLRWSSLFGGAGETWIYGPLVPFGTVRMPAWGVRLEDGYRFHYREIAFDDAPPPALAPPQESSHAASLDSAPSEEMRWREHDVQAVRRRWMRSATLECDSFTPEATMR